MPRQKEMTLEELNELIINYDKEIANKKSQINNLRAQIVKAEQAISDLENKKSSTIMKIAESHNIDIMELLIKAIPQKKESDSSEV